MVLIYLHRAIERTYESYQEDIIHLNVYFDQTTALQFKTQASLSWLEYFANIGGLLGLCIGLSIVTVFEIVWLMIKIGSNLLKGNLKICKKKKPYKWARVLKWGKIKKAGCLEKTDIILKLKCRKLNERI